MKLEDGIIPGKGREAVASEAGAQQGPGRGKVVCAAQCLDRSSDRLSNNSTRSELTYDCRAGAGCRRRTTASSSPRPSLRSQPRQSRSNASPRGFAGSAGRPGLGAAPPGGAAAGRAKGGAAARPDQTGGSGGAEAALATSHAHTKLLSHNAISRDASTRRPPRLQQDRHAVLGGLMLRAERAPDPLERMLAVCRWAGSTHLRCDTQREYIHARHAFLARDRHDCQRRRSGWRRATGCAIVLQASEAKRAEWASVALSASRPILPTPSCERCLPCRVVLCLATDLVRPGRGFGDTPTVVLGQHYLSRRQLGQWAAAGGVRGQGQTVLGAGGRGAGSGSTCLACNGACTHCTHHQLYTFHCCLQASATAATPCSSSCRSWPHTSHWAPPSTPSTRHQPAARPLALHCLPLWQPRCRCGCARRWLPASSPPACWPSWAAAARSARAAAAAGAALTARRLPG